jgi:hypothetical protein
MATSDKKKKIWDNYKVIGEVRKSEAIKFVVAAAYRDGVQYINIREFYLRKKDNEWRPGRDGITVPVIIPVNGGKERVHTYTQLGDLMATAVAELAVMPMEDAENAVWYTPKEDK